jgi:hypothetical protein
LNTTFNTQDDNESLGSDSTNKDMDYTPSEESVGDDTGRKPVKRTLTLEAACADIVDQGVDETRNNASDGLDFGLMTPISAERVSE